MTRCFFCEGEPVTETFTLNAPDPFAAVTGNVPERKEYPACADCAKLVRKGEREKLAVRETMALVKRNHEPRFAHKRLLSVLLEERATFWAMVAL